VAVCPAVTVADVEEPEEISSEKSVPVPERLTVCGLPGASCVMVRLPSRVPVAVGLKVTLIVQLAPAATLEPQVLVWAKSPLTPMLVMVNGPLPVLVSVTVCSVLLLLSWFSVKWSEAVFS